MRATRIGVALCTFQGERFIAEQLRSIAAQSVPVDIVVIGDDGSSDGTMRIVSELVEELRLPAILLPSGDGLGVAANFARTIAACDADIVLLSDQDDVWMPDRVATSIAVFDSQPATLALHGDAILVDAFNKPTGGSLFGALGIGDAYFRQVDEGRAFEALLRRNLATGATMALRRELVELALPIPAGWIHDEWFAVTAAAHGALAVHATPMIRYRQHGGNAIGASALSLRDAVRRLTADGSERNARLLLRAEGLASRATGFPEGRRDELGALARHKVAHETMRASLSRHRLLRIRPVARAVRSGAYWRFGNGIGDVVRDLVQPLHRS